ncbi:MAG: Mu-like prophage major head subunit gpT family protein [Anaerolineae bacterium]|nr:Mu-like prophage major head subunit gpT family protein [Anaerolineae bacterium]
MKRERITLTGGTLGPALNVALMRPGQANGLHFAEAVLIEGAERFAGAPCFVDHASAGDLLRPGGRSVRDLVGLIVEPHWDAAAGELRARLELSSQAGWLLRLIEEFGPYPQVLGLSADLWITREGRAVRRIEKVNSVDVVVNPAAGGRFLAKEEAEMQEEKRLQMAQSPEPAGEKEAPTEAHSAPQRETKGTPALAGVPNELAELKGQLLELQLAQAALPEPLKEAARAFAARCESTAELSGYLKKLTEAWAEANAQRTIRGLGQRISVRSGLERLTLAFERLMGLPETSAHRDVPRLSGIRELYHLLTGDYEMHGVFYPERVHLANVTTSTMANVVANVLNKVLLRAYEARPQWWRPIVHEEDFSSMREIRWITLGGFGDLDTVAEGDAYTEKTWDDYAETASFVKKGNYVGITLEMIDRDDVAALRAIPRKLGLAANRTLSAAIAGIFTQNGGVGPTLADGKALFHADHGNLGASALDADSWDAAIQAMFKQAEFHSGKRLGIRPRYCLVPIELEKTALTIFTSDREPGTNNNDANVRRNSSSVITVPEWTDANDWAAVADPNDLEGICIGYRFGRAPEIFVADANTSGAMFTNDELRIKVRFVYAVGVGDYRALYKANVA